jgi:hypothetical protein
MQIWRLPPDFWTAIEKGIQHLSQDTQESTSPPLPFENFSQPNQESPPISLKRTKVNQVGEHLQGSLVTQVAEIHHRACPLEMAGPASPRAEPQIRHINVGPLPSYMEIPQ